jgi:carboxylesterase
MPRRAALVIHGFTAQPKTVEFVKPYLERAGFNTVLPRLPGHGTRPEDMEHVTWNDWYQAGLDSLRSLQATHDEVHVLGHSMGGLVASMLAAHAKVDALVLVATALQFQNPAVKALPLLGPFVKYWDGGPSGIVDMKLREEAEVAKITYKRFPVAAFRELLAFAKIVPNMLPKVQCPTLVIHSRVDEVITPSSSDLLFARLGSSDKTQHWFEKSSHEMFWDFEREPLCQLITDFFVARSKLSPIVTT